MSREPLTRIQWSVSVYASVSLSDTHVTRDPGARRRCPALNLLASACLSASQTSASSWKGGPIRPPEVALTSGPVGPERAPTWPWRALLAGPMGKQVAGGPLPTGGPMNTQYPSSRAGRERRGVAARAHPERLQHASSGPAQNWRQGGGPGGRPGRRGCQQQAEEPGQEAVAVGLGKPPGRDLNLHLLPTCVAG